MIITASRGSCVCKQVYVLGIVYRQDSVLYTYFYYLYEVRFCKVCMCCKADDGDTHAVEQGVILCGVTL